MNRIKTVKLNSKSVGGVRQKKEIMDMKNEYKLQGDLFNTTL